MNKEQEYKLYDTLALLCYASMVQSEILGKKNTAMLNIMEHWVNAGDNQDLRDLLESLKNG